MTRRRTLRRSGSERGLLSTELALMMPIILVIAFVAVAMVQRTQVVSRTQAAADSAARAASMFGTDVGAAQSAAQSAASNVCQGPVSISMAPPTPPTTIRPGRVTVEVTCTESVLGVFDAGDTYSSTAVGVAAIEYWRP